MFKTEPEKDTSFPLDYSGPLSGSHAKRKNFKSLSGKSISNTNHIVAGTKIIIFSQYKILNNKQWERYEKSKGVEKERQTVLKLNLFNFLRRQK